MDTSPKITAILAGGNARRFGGQDKGEIIIGDNRLIDIIHARLSVQSTDIIISGTSDYGLGVSFIADSDDAPAGPVGGLYSIWQVLKPKKIEGFFTVAVDGPNLPSNLIESLYSNTNSTIAVDGAGRHPTYGWWRIEDLSVAWVKLQGEPSISLNRLADVAKAKEVSWDRSESFININHAEDLERYVKDT
ncbi:molybdenum cofactor guanylyltransferase [Hellea balneolensis]|uniref:molybdenum cofactor guanylyltransferase n=1 Tax=Hellea balneolensis TaxID=287478 RepID=UPI00041475CF|nr:NTP transferase domain-containing protein [Hellea balneolensis]